MCDRTSSPVDFTARLHAAGRCAASSADRRSGLPFQGDVDKHGQGPKEFILLNSYSEGFAELPSMRCTLSTWLCMQLADNLKQPPSTIMSRCLLQFVFKHVHRCTIDDFGELPCLRTGRLRIGY